MAGNRLASLRSQRNFLLEEYKEKKGPEGTKLLVRIMDLDEDIDRELQNIKRKYKQIN